MLIRYMSLDIGLKNNAEPATAQPEMNVQV